MANPYITADAIPEDFAFKQAPVWNISGGSGIIDPFTGQYTVGPVYDKETIVYGEIDMGQVALAKAYYDVAGHWARWDVANLNLNEEEQVPFKPMNGRSRQVTRSEFQELAKAVKELCARARHTSNHELAESAEALRNKVEALEASAID
mgnify:CR=1 FL=1